MCSKDQNPKIISRGYKLKKSEITKSEYKLGSQIQTIASNPNQFPGLQCLRLN